VIGRLVVDMSELPVVVVGPSICTPLKPGTGEVAVDTLWDVINEVLVLGSPVPLRNVVAFRLLFRADGWMIGVTREVGVSWSIFFCIAETLALEASSVDSTFRLSGSCDPRQHVDR
jgi:hypothetical protein